MRSLWINVSGCRKPDSLPDNMALGSLPTAAITIPNAVHYYATSRYTQVCRWAIGGVWTFAANVSERELAATLLLLSHARPIADE